MWFCEDAWARLPLTAMIEIYKLIDQYKGQLHFRHDQGKMQKGMLLWPPETRIKAMLFQEAIK